MLEITYKKILAVAVPLMFGTFVQSIVMLTDISFVSELGTISFNAVNNASLIYISLFMINKGLADGTQIIISNYFGKNDTIKMNEYLYHSLLNQAFLGFILFAIFYFLSEPLIMQLVKSKATGNDMTEFLKYRSWGIIFAGFHASLSSLFIGIGKTKVVLISTLVMAISNIILDYALIFGHFGFSSLGLKGAPIASSISELLAFFVYIYFIQFNDRFKEFKLKIYTFHKAINASLFKLSTPLMLQGFMALSGWLVFFTLIERKMSPHDLEVSTIVRSLYFLAFIPTFGFGATTRTYVSYYLGKNEANQIGLIQRKIIFLNLLSIIILCHGALLYPEFLIPFVNQNPEIIKDTSQVMQLIMGSLILLSIVTVWFNAVAAIGKSKQVFLIESISMFAYLIACYLFIVPLKFSIVAVWSVEYVYFGLLGLCSFLYLKHYQSKNNLTW